MFSLSSPAEKWVLILYNKFEMQEKKGVVILYLVSEV